jgi:hypothetical protein
MSDIDYARLQGGEGGAPPDGTYTAYLMRAEIIDTSKGSMLITEWQHDTHWWEAWFGFTGQRLAVTQSFLRGLGVLHLATDDDALELALAKAAGSSYIVRVEHNGNFVNTSIAKDGPPMDAQAELPVQDSDLPTEPVPVAKVPADDDIPF